MRTRSLWSLSFGLCFRLQCSIFLFSPLSAKQNPASPAQSGPHWAVDSCLVLRYQILEMVPVFQWSSGFCYFFPSSAGMQFRGCQFSRTGVPEFQGCNTRLMLSFEPSQSLTLVLFWIESIPITSLLLLVFRKLLGSWSHCQGHFSWGYSKFVSFLAS